MVLANGPEFGNRIRIAPAARVDDAALDLIVVSERSRLGTIGRLPLLLAGALERSSAWSSQRVAEVVVRSAHPMLFHVDGEPVQGGTTLSGRVLSGALKVCV